MANSKKTAVLLLAHGSPDSVDQVPDFLLRVTGGRPLSQPVVDEVKHRYGLIGRSPLTELTLMQAERLGGEMGMPVYVGMRNWNPFIADAVNNMVKDGIEYAVAICLAPQNSRTSVGLYRSALAETGTPFTVDFVESWHDQPGLIRAFAEKLRIGWNRACDEAKTENVPIIFTAHSVPERTITDGDPYESQAKETALLVAREAALAAEDWTFAFQSRACPAEHGWVRELRIRFSG